jgi:hypothetical protein
MRKLKTTVSVADILERELEPTIKDWLLRVNLVPALTKVPLSDADRTAHLPKLYFDLILRLAKHAAAPISFTAAAHGKVRYAQGYSADMLVEESRLFLVATFGALHLHLRQSELDQNQVRSDLKAIADEVDAQLVESVRTFMGAKVAEAVAHHTFRTPAAAAVAYPSPRLVGL